MSLVTSNPNLETISLSLPKIELNSAQTCPNRNNQKNDKKTKLTRKKPKVIFPKLLSCREVELVTNLSIDSTGEGSPLSDSLLQEKEKERIETSVEIRNKRKGIRRENSDQNIQGITAIEKEFKSSHSKEFYIKYETLQKEKKMEEEIINAKAEIGNLKDKKDRLYNQMIKTLSEIYNCDLDITIIDSDEYFASKKNEVLMNLNNASETEQFSSPVSPSRKKRGGANPKKKLDQFVLKTLNMKEQALKNEKKNSIIQTKSEYLDKLKTLRDEIEKIKTIINKKKKILKGNVKRLLDHYHKILYEGLDARQEGLMWVIKAIWNLGENVKLSFFPTFLDPISIDYLFTIAHKNVEISQLKCEIEKNKMKLHLEFTQLENKNSISNDMAIFRTSVNQKNNALNFDKLKHKKEKEETKGEVLTLRKISNLFTQKDPLSDVFNLPSIESIGKLANRKEKIEKELKLLRKKEMLRLFKEFIENNYENKYHASIETVIAALVGELKKDKELVEFSKIKKVNFIILLFFRITLKI